MSAAGKTFLWLFIIFILIPALLVLAGYLIVKYSPDSPAGKEIQRRYSMYKEMASKEYARRQELRRERRENNALAMLNRQKEMETVKGVDIDSIENQKDRIAAKRAARGRMSFLSGPTPDDSKINNSNLNDTTSALTANIDQFKTAESRA